MVAGKVPNTRDWKADLQPGAPAKLIVTGQVEITNTSAAPQLHVRSPQGINPRILLLDLLFRSSGHGEVTWQDVRYEADIQKEQYFAVEIFCSGAEIVQVKVEAGQ
jgi:hypothetical protein